MERRFILLMLFLILCSWVKGQGIDLKDVRYSPGKVTRGEKASYKAFIPSKVPIVLFVTNVNCQDTAVFTTYYKDGTVVGPDNMDTADRDFSMRRLRDTLFGVFSESTLQKYKQREPALKFSVKFDEDGNVLDVYFVFFYKKARNYYDGFLDMSPEVLYELEQRIRKIVKVKKNSQLALFQNFKTMYLVSFFKDYND